MNRLENELWWTTEPAYIPFISHETMMKMRYIEPLLRDATYDVYRRIKGQADIHPSAQGFLHAKTEPVGPELVFSALTKISIVSFHKMQSCFVPSLAEVYSAIRRFCDPWKNIKFFSLHEPQPRLMGDYYWCVCDLFGDIDE